MEMSLHKSSHLDSPFRKHPLHHISVRPQHACVMDSKAAVKQLLHFFVPRFPYISTEKTPLRMVFATEIISIPFQERGFLEAQRSLYCLLSCMHKNHNLMALSYKFRNLLEGNAI